MLLKRFIVLAAGVLLFIAAFIIYTDVSHARMEARFRAEREKFNVDGVTLTTSGPSSSIVSPAATPAPDTNTLIGPVPPSGSTTPDGMTTPDSSTAPATDTNSAPATSMPDTNSTPAPATPDTNAAPSSTMSTPRPGSSPLFQLASFRPSDTAVMPMAGALATQTSAPPVAPTASSPEVPPKAAPAISNLTVAPAATNATPAAKSLLFTSRPSATDGKVIVLLFHQFKPAGVPIPAKFQWTMNQDVFESEMKYVHDNGYHVIPMSDLLKFLRHEITLPSNSVCITIDDGYKSAIVYAAPILKKYGFPWTFFIYPDFITTGEGPGAASWNDLLQLQADGVDIESHSMTHPNLKLHKQKVKGVWHDFTPDEYAAWLKNETAGSKALLEEKMGKPITCFAYPYGEYNTQVQQAAIDAGYEAIFTVADNPVHASTNMYSIGRYTITQGVEKNFTAYLRQGALEITKADPAPGATITNPRPVITATLGYPGSFDPKSIETQVRDFGDVRHDYDPQTSTLRLYLPRDLIQPTAVLVNIRVRDTASGQVAVANWHFNYQPEGGAPAVHKPIAPATNSAAVSPTTPAASATNAPVAPEPESMERNAAGTPLDAHPTTPPAPSAPPIAPSTRD
jgi:peptidoglycan/xylan/chitin deacetylase (PgdA/CDA1 family)